MLRTSKHNKKKSGNDWSQMIVIIISAIIGYLFYDANPGEVFDLVIMLSVAIASVFVIIILLVLTYIIQQFVAKSLHGKIHYEFWPWGIFATVVIGVLNTGLFVFYMPGIFRFKKMTRGISERLLESSRIESVAIAGVGASLGLLFALVFINTGVLAKAAASFAVWNMLPIPKTNGFHFFNWHPLHAGFTGILGLIVLIMYIISGITPFLILVTILFIPYHWFYVYVLAKRSGY